MDTVVFSNRMGPKTLLYIALGFVALGALFIAVGRREDILLMLGIVVGIYVLTMALIWIVVRFTAKNNVAELTLRPNGLTAEMIHMTGKGDKLDLPPSRPEDWSWEVHRYGKNKQQKTAVITLKSADRSFKLWLSGAKVVNAAALRDLAPTVASEMQAAGYIKG